MNDVLDRDIRAALADLLDTAPNVPARPTITDREPAAGTGAPDRRPLIAAAAVLVLIGVFGLVQVARPDDPPQPGTVSTPTVAPTVGPAPVSTAPTPVATTVPGIEETASPSTVPVPDPDDPPGVFLPTSIPDGYVIGFVDVIAGPTGENSASANSRHFVRTEAGRPVASITVSVVPALSPTTDPPPSGGPTVHGQVATSFDSGEGRVVYWLEAGLYASVKAIGLDEGAVLAIAESTVVTGGQAPSIDLPEPPAGFEERVADGPTIDTVSSMLQLLPQPAVPGVFVDVSAYPNIDRFTIDLLEVQYTTLEGTTERVVVRGQEALLHTSPTDGLGTMAFVTWIEDTSIVSVQGRVPRDELLPLAETVAPDSLQRAKALHTAADDSLLALDELDRAVLPSGIEVVVLTDGNGATGICAFTDSPDSATCERYQTEGSLAGERQDVATATLVIDGEPLGIGWALGEHSPRSYQDAESTVPLADVAVTDVGTFLAVPIDTPDGVTFVFDAPAGTIYNLIAGPESLID